MRSLELSTREGDGHVVVVLREASRPRRRGSTFTWRLAVALFQRSGGTGTRAEAGTAWSWPARSWRCPGWPGTRPTGAGTTACTPTT